MNTDIITAVVPSFLVAFVGYYYSTRDAKLDMKSIANLIYYILSPCMTYSSMAKHPFQLQEFMMLSVSVVILIFSLMFVTFFYMRATGEHKKGFYLPIIFMNTGNIALPMAWFLYGNDGMSKAIIFHLVNVMFLYTMGVFMVSKKTSWKEFFKIPFVYAAVGGVIVAVSPFALPPHIQPVAKLLNEAISVLGQGAVPMLILSLGYSLKRTRITDLSHAMAGAGIRVILGPAIAFGLILFYREICWSPIELSYGDVLFKDARITEGVILLMAAMPAPIASFLLNEKFENAPEVAASMVLIGSLAGIVTIPLVLKLSQQFIFGM